MTRLFRFFCSEMFRLIDFCIEHYSQKSFDSVCVAVSGGSDSLSLLIMATEWARQNDMRVYCVTVDHKLREESAEEAKFVEDFCRSIGVEHKILNWERAEHSVAHGKLENLARETRYKLISEFCENNDIPLLLVGHTWNDQLETYEMRKNSGSRSSGLACMSQVRSLTDRVKILRPILHFTKSYLEDFLKNRNVSWKIDPMNDREIFLRVSYRKKIAGYDNDKISVLSKEIARFGKIRNEIETRAVQFLKDSCVFFDEYAEIEKDKFLSQEKTIQAEILKRIIWNVGGKKYALSITNDICNKILSKEINTLGRCLIKIKKSKIFFFREDRNGKGVRFLKNYKLFPPHLDPLPQGEREELSVFINLPRLFLNENNQKAPSPLAGEGWGEGGNNKELKALDEAKEEKLSGLSCDLQNHKMTSSVRAGLFDVFFCGANDE